MKKTRKEPCTNQSAGIVIWSMDPVSQQAYVPLQLRRWPPYGWAPSAGHIDTGESPLAAAIRELREEFGISLDPAQVDLKLIWYRPDNICGRANGRGHQWNVYMARVPFDMAIRQNPKEAKVIGAFSPTNLQRMADHTLAYQAGKISEADWQRMPGLEPVWLKFMAHPSLALINPL